MHEFFVASIGLALTLFVAECLNIEKNDVYHPWKIIILSLALGAAILPSFIGLFPQDPDIAKVSKATNITALGSVCLSLWALLLPVFKKERKRAIAVILILISCFAISLAYLNLALN